jgi:ribonucleoside-diphosphate reductase alpha chain
VEEIILAVINDNTQKLLEDRYFFKDKETGELLESKAEEMFLRVAKTVAKAEKTPELQEKYEKIFFDLMNKQLFMPNTPTLIGAGYGKCLSACSVVGRIPDSLEDIYDYMWKNAKLTKYGCGVGQDLSNIRPLGDIIKSSGGKSAGVVNWMNLINTVANTTIQGDKARRAANMVSLRFNHPDIIDFIHSKEEDGNLSSMNISIIIKDNEMKAIKEDEEIWLEWNNKKYKKIRAKEIFQHIIDGLWQNGEPGAILIDSINNKNSFNLQDGCFDESNKHYMFTTNPCGEQPLENFEFCNLGSINVELLYNEIKKEINYDLFKHTIISGIRFLDNTIDINEYVLPEFEKNVLGNRKIGLGIAGFANLLIKLGLKYDSQETLDFIDKFFGFKQKIENEYNIELALEKGNFPNWHESIYCKNNIPARCACISTQAPTGSIASILNTTAYGIEPLFSVAYKRRIVTGEIYEASEIFGQMLHALIKDEEKEQKILKECFDKGTSQINSVPKKLRELFRCANDISPEWHIKIQAKIQEYYDNAISKTINAPENSTKEELFDLLIKSWEMGIKGVTYYRNNSRKNQTIQIGNKETHSVSLNCIQPISRSKLGRTFGSTVDKRSACGRMYITINRDDNGNIIESFVNVGKAGICRSNIDGINRLVSLALRSGVKVEEIIDQLKSIDCKACTNRKAKGDKIDGTSCPDIIGRTLEEEFLQLKENKINEREIENKCPDCGQELQLTEGCQKCSNPDCGYSKCN